MPRIRQDQRPSGNSEPGIQQRAQDGLSGWVESRLSEVLQVEKSWALTVESFQVSRNGLYAVGNEVGLNTVSGGSTRQAGRGEAWTDFRL